jgi:hypothetical protein
MWTTEVGLNSTRERESECRHRVEQMSMTEDPRLATLLDELIDSPMA